MPEAIEIRRVLTAEDARSVEALARKIWREHYTSIIGEEQVAYMLGKFQSTERILEDINSGAAYYQAFVWGMPAGYACVKLARAAGSLFLSKLYVEKAFRGRGVAKKLLRHALDGCPGEPASVWLTVNKHNADSILIYQKMGFTVKEKLVTDIGGGFVMDDYKMVLPLGHPADVNA